MSCSTWSSHSRSRHCRSTAYADLTQDDSHRKIIGSDFMLTITASEGPQQRVDLEGIAEAVDGELLPFP